MDKLKLAADICTGVGAVLTAGGVLINRKRQDQRDEQLIDKKLDEREKKKEES